MNLLVFGAAILAAWGVGGADGASSPDGAQAARASANVTRAERLAEIFERIVMFASSRHWRDLQTAFPGVRWEAEPTYDPATRAEWTVRPIDVAGTPYRLGASGTPTRVNTIHFEMDRPGDLVNRDRLRAAVRARGMTWTLEYCDEFRMPGFGIGSGDNWLVVSLGRPLGQGDGVTDLYIFEFDASPGASDDPDEYADDPAPEASAESQLCG